MTRATYQQLLDHLLACSDDFVPPLHTYVDIAAYAERLAGHAVRLERFEDTSQGERLVALLALYVDGDHTAFVTNVSVLAHARRRGLGDELVEELLDVARRRGLRRARLEVHRSNHAACRLYRRHGFIASGTTSADTAPERITLERTLGED